MSCTSVQITVACHLYGVGLQHKKWHKPRIAPDKFGHLSSQGMWFSSLASKNLEPP